jgi:hypothetical protein
MAAVVVAAGGWLSMNLRTKQKYDHFRGYMLKDAPAVRPLDETTKAVLSQAAANWEKVSSELDGVHSKGLELIELHPSVMSLTEICKFQMPEYSFASPAQNKMATIWGLSQLTMFAPSTDKALHISDDGHLAVMQCGGNVIYVFSDEQDRLRETFYRRRTTAVDAKTQADAPTQRAR